MVLYWAGRFLPSLKPVLIRADNRTRNRRVHRCRICKRDESLFNQAMDWLSHRFVYNLLTAQGIQPQRLEVGGCWICLPHRRCIVCAAKIRLAEIVRGGAAIRCPARQFLAWSSWSAGAQTGCGDGLIGRWLLLATVGVKEGLGTVRSERRRERWRRERCAKMAQNGSGEEWPPPRSGGPDG